MTEVPHERRTALLVQVPVEDPVDDFRRRHLAASVARGLPAHVTVLFPFAPRRPSMPSCVRRSWSTSRHSPRSRAELTRVGRFDAHVWLAPEPHERFIALLAGTYARFPLFPPYGDAFAEPVPHLTIAEVGPDGSIERVTEEAESALGPGLPFAFDVDRIGLFEELTDGTWQQSDSFELG